MLVCVHTIISATVSLNFHATDQIYMLFFKFTVGCHNKVRVQLQEVCLMAIAGKSIFGHPPELTGNDSMKRDPNYCLIWLIVATDKCIPTEVLLKTYRLLTSSCQYAQWLLLHRVGHVLYSKYCCEIYLQDNVVIIV